MRHKYMPVKGLLAVLVIGLLGGCGSSMMIRADQAILLPAENAAMVHFLRPSLFGGAIDFGIWDGERLVGVLTPKTQIQYKTTHGEHLFMARAENWDAVKGELLPGKNYYILVQARMGLIKARVAMTVLDPDDKRLGEWLGVSNPVKPDPAKEAAYVAERVAHVRQAIKNYESGKAQYSVFESSQGK